MYKSLFICAVFFNILSDVNFGKNLRAGDILSYQYFLYIIERQITRMVVLGKRR